MQQTVEHDEHDDRHEIGHAHKAELIAVRPDKAPREQNAIGQQRNIHRDDALLFAPGVQCGGYGIGQHRADAQAEQTGDELIFPDYRAGRVKIKYERKGCRGEGRRGDNTYCLCELLTKLHDLTSGKL